LTTYSMNYFKTPTKSDLDITIKDHEAKIKALEAELNYYKGEASAGNYVVPRRHALPNTQYVITDTTGSKLEKGIGTRGSQNTSAILESLDIKKEQSEGHLKAEKFITVFNSPTTYSEYLQSEEFAEDLMLLTVAVRPIFEEERRCLELQSPVYVFGDIHGNLEDLHFFSDNIWKLGVDLTAGKFLFLGDYVDRGLSCLECVAYLLSLKFLNPGKVFMLRGNHETRDVNGWEDHYGDKSFLYQCKKRFGVDLGETVWEEVNQVFDRLPLAATIDKDIFCVHGGIPRLPSVEHASEIEAINSVPTVAGIMPSFKHETNNSRQIATDCIGLILPVKNKKLIRNMHWLMDFLRKIVYLMLKDMVYPYVVVAFLALVHKRSIYFWKGMLYHSLFVLMRLMLMVWLFLKGPSMVYSVCFVM